MSSKKLVVFFVLALSLIMGTEGQLSPAHAGTQVYVGFDLGGIYTPYNGSTYHVHHRPPPPPPYGWWGPPPPPPRGWYRHHPPPRYWDDRSARHRHHHYAQDRYGRW